MSQIATLCPSEGSQFEKFFQPVQSGEVKRNHIIDVRGSLSQTNVQNSLPSSLVAQMVKSLPAMQEAWV